MRNSVSSKQKFSKLEKMLSKSILIIMAIEAFMCLVAAAVATIWIRMNADDTESYLSITIP